MQQDDRGPFTAALEDARRTGYPPGQYAGQESFLCARDIRALAERAEIGEETTVLDLCCGVAGPGRLIAEETGCDYVGVDASCEALRIAQRRCRGLRCRFVHARVPPVPGPPADVVLVLGTMLAFADKASLVRAVSRRLTPGGRFACTVETGTPLTAREREQMPDADTVHLIEEEELMTILSDAGLQALSCRDATADRRATAHALWQAYRADAARIAGSLGRRATDDLIAAHRLWVSWMSTGRVRDLEIVTRLR